MGVSMGKTGNSEVAEINMTPLIDVLLVLLVIFIIVQMQMQRAFDIQLPVDKDESRIPSTNITMEIAEDGGVKINTKAVQPAALGAFLKEIYEGRPDKIIFVKASPEAQYGQVIEYIDVARASGVTVVGAVLTTTMAGPTPR
jgi:biopolymer transport protein TolR